MHQFKDAAGRTWNISVTVGSIKRVRDLLKINLLDVVDRDAKGRLFEQLASDPILLCDVLYALVKDQCVKEGVSDAEFGEGLAGDALDSATQALLEDLADFFPQGKRKLIKTAIVKLNRFQSIAEERALAKIESPQFDQLIETRITAALAASSD